jgi:hypothetical protein
MADADTIASRIVRLILKAESTEHEGERSLLIAKAQELQLRYAIDQEQLDRMHPDQASEQIVERSVEIGHRGTGVAGRRMLAHHISESLPIRGFRRTGTRMFVWVGYESDVALAELLYAALLVQGEAELARAARRRPSWTAPATFRANFLLAYAEQVGERLAQQAAEQADEVQREIDDRGESTSVALVIASRSERVDHKVKEKYRLRNLRSAAPAWCGHARSAGRRAGKRADITPQRRKVGERKQIRPGT